MNRDAMTAPAVAASKDATKRETNNMVVRSKGGTPRTPLVSAPPSRGGCRIPVAFGPLGTSENHCRYWTIPVDTSPDTSRLKKGRYQSSIPVVRRLFGCFEGVLGAFDAISTTIPNNGPFSPVFRRLRTVVGVGRYQSDTSRHFSTFGAAERVAERERKTMGVGPSERRRQWDRRECYVCGEYVPEGEGTWHTDLKLFTHAGKSATCNRMVTSVRKDYTHSRRGKRLPPAEVRRRLDRLLAEGKRTP